MGLPGRVGSMGKRRSLFIAGDTGLLIGRFTIPVTHHCESLNKFSLLIPVPALRGGP